LYRLSSLGVLWYLLEKKSGAKSMKKMDFD
jgi:hypothetical protein